MARLGNILKCLDDPRYPCLGPHLRLLSLVGIWHPYMKFKLTRFKLAIVYLNITFFVSQYIKCLIKFDADSLKLILQYAPFHMGVAKTCFFQKDYKKWERLIKFISAEELNQISKKDKKQDGIINDYINRSRRVTSFFWALAFFSNFSIFSEPYQKNQISENETSVYVFVFDGYTPFAREPPGYYCSMFIQTVLGNMMSAYVVGWDMIVVSIMIFFTGQLRISKLYCKRVVDLKNVENSYHNIAKFHQFYTKLIQYQKEFNDLISPVMFIYLIVVCINLGVCIIQIAEIQGDIPTLVSGCLFIMACLVQLLLFYWHANEVTIENPFWVILYLTQTVSIHAGRLMVSAMAAQNNCRATQNKASLNALRHPFKSERVTYSTFKSDWVYADKSVQKEIALLSLTTTKSLVFRAGPFNEMSLATFVSILRTSYSFYTLLKGTN